MQVLLTGGAGYIGSHIAVELAKAGHQIIVADNLSNSRPEVVEAIEQVIGQAVKFYQIDIRDRQKLAEVFRKNKIEAVIHLAGLKIVEESIRQPLAYYENNLNSTFVLLDVMQEFHCQTLVFSSSAAIYGDPTELPLLETSTTGLTMKCPYARTKYMIEEILKDVAIADPNWNITLLRYFNPVGAHESGLLGEEPTETPTNLMPFVAKVATGELPEVKVNGNDYDTPDGTGIRDYIHVVDLARGHVAALKNSTAGLKIYNLSTGHGTSVLELIADYQTASGQTIAYTVVGRRDGDIAVSFADASKALAELGWQAEKTVLDASRDDWKFRKAKKSAKNPK